MPEFIPCGFSPWHKWIIAATKLYTPHQPSTWLLLEFKYCCAAMSFILLGQPLKKTVVHSRLEFGWTSTNSIYLSEFWLETKVFLMNCSATGIRSSTSGTHLPTEMQRYIANLPLDSSDPPIEWDAQSQPIILRRWISNLLRVGSLALGPLLTPLLMTLQRRNTLNKRRDRKNRCFPLRFFVSSIT